MKMEETKSIPVVFAADDTYAPYLGVAIYSLIANTSKEHRYKIYILTCGLSEEHERRILALRTDNVSIEVINIDKYMESVNWHGINHLSQATSFRLAIENLRNENNKLMFKEYSKLIYLDCDLVVLTDVSELYQTDIENYVMGAVRGRMFKFNAENITKNLHLKNGFRDYVNSGVLLINLSRFREERIGSQGLKMLAEDNEKKYLCADQDVINILCEGKIKFLDWPWNVEWEHLTGEDRTPVVDETRRGSLEYVNHPYIIHYTCPRKPWKYPQYRLAEYFWHYARQTVFYEEILARNLLQQPPAAGEAPSKTEPVLPDPVSVALPRDWDRFVFPWHLIAPGSRVVIRGGGVVGKVFVQQLQATQYAQVEAVCDRQAVPGLPVPCIRPQELSAVDCDAVVIALEKPSIAAEIRQELLQLGIPAGKIKYANPARMR